MLANGCSAEAVELIVALDDLMSSRFGSRREFIEAVAAHSGSAVTLPAESAYGPARLEFAVPATADSPGIKVMSERMLSDEMGSERFSSGPRWETARLIAEHCSHDGRWIPGLARIAGLWARAHGVPRPTGYDGPLFPAVTCADPVQHLEALADCFPPAHADRRRCPRARGRQSVRTPFRVAILWVVAVLVLRAHISFHWLAAQSSARVGDGRGWSSADWWGFGLSMASIVLFLAPALSSSVWYARLRPGWGMNLVSPPHAVGGSTQVFHYRRVRDGVAPVRRGRLLANTVTWSLSANAVVFTPLGLGPWWLPCRAGFIVSRLTACLNGELGLLDSPENDGEPLVEWALVSDEGYVHATGLLPAPVTQAHSRNILLPGYGRILSRSLYQGDFAESGLTDDDVAALSPDAVRWTDLTGKVNWPAVSQVNVVLRRLDVLSFAVQVRWENSGMHIHHTYPPYLRG
jgi:hypothetical protein